MKSRFRETIIEDNRIFKITGEVDGWGVERNKANCFQQSNVGCENCFFFDIVCKFRLLIPTKAHKNICLLLLSLFSTPHLNSINVPNDEKQKKKSSTK